MGVKAFVLTGDGDLSLLNPPTVGLAGSRDASRLLMIVLARGLSSSSVTEPPRAGDSKDDLTGDVFGVDARTGAVLVDGCLRNGDCLPGVKDACERSVAMLASSHCNYHDLVPIFYGLCSTMSCSQHK